MSIRPGHLLGLGLLIMSLALPVGLRAAQAAGKTGPVLSGNDLSEEALIRILTPSGGGDKPSEANAGSGERARTLVIGPNRMAPGQRSRESAGGSRAQGGVASLLITFETNSSEISASSLSILEKVAGALKSEQLARFRFDVEGHADPRGNSADNLRLSQARAASVVAYLVGKQGIDANRLRPVGKGDRELANTRNKLAPENRRVTLRNQASPTSN